MDLDRNHEQKIDQDNRINKKKADARISQGTAQQKPNQEFQVPNQMYFQTTQEKQLEQRPAGTIRRSAQMQAYLSDNIEKIDKHPKAHGNYMQSE